MLAYFERPVQTSGEPDLGMSSVEEPRKQFVRYAYVQHYRNKAQDARNILEKVMTTRAAMSSKSAAYDSILPGETQAQRDLYSLRDCAEHIDMPFRSHNRL